MSIPNINTSSEILSTYFFLIELEMKSTDSDFVSEENSVSSPHLIYYDVFNLFCVQSCDCESYT